MKNLNICLVGIILSGSLFLPGCQTGQTKAVATPEVLAEFDFSLKEGLILVPVTFEEKEYQFALDTGASFTVFDDYFKDKLGKQFFWPLKVHGPEGTTYKLEYHFQQKAYLDNIRLDDNGLIKVCNLDQSLISKNKDYYGIVGQDFLKKYIVQADFDNGKVTFFKGKKDFNIFGFFKSKENKHPEWGQAIPLKKKYSGLRLIKGTLSDNTKAEFIIDSGWAIPDALKSKVFDKIQSGALENKKSENSTDKDSKSNFKFSKIDKLSVGQFEYNNVLFKKSNFNILGMPFLSRHFVTFDFPNNMIYLKKGKYFDKPHYLFGMIVKEMGIELNFDDTNITISDIDPNSSAYKGGLRQNDALIKIYDQYISSLSLSEILEILSGILEPENTEARFTFSHGDNIITTSFVRRIKNEKKN